MKAGEIDFGVALESAVPSELACIRWRTVRTALLTTSDHALSKVNEVSIEDIAKYPLILPPRSAEYGQRGRLEELFRANGLDFRVIMESSNVELSSLYVERGLGISFATLAEDVPGLSRRRLAFIPLDHYFPPDYIAVVLRKDKILAPHKQAFLDILLRTRTASASGSKIPLPP